MNAFQLLAELRNPSTRWDAARTIAIAVFVASGSIGGTIIGTQGATGLWAVLMERLTFPMIQAEIESLRSDVSTIPCSAAVMLAAQAADWNRRISHEHESNKHWYSDWASTDRWNDITTISMPCREDHSR